MAFDDIKQKLAEFVPVMDGLSRARNPFELRYYVVGRHDDRIQQYKQAVIEMDAKYRTCEEGHFDLLRKDLEMERLRRQLSSAPADRDQEIRNELLLLDIGKVERDAKQIRIGMCGAMKEVLDFIAIIEAEFADLVDKTEEQLLEHEPEYWRSRLSRQCAVDVVTDGRVGPGNLAAVMQLPRAVQEAVMVSTTLLVEEHRSLARLASKQAALILAESYPQRTMIAAPPVYRPLKLLRDAPDDYPENLVVRNDILEIMTATMHRPTETVCCPKCRRKHEIDNRPGGINAVKCCGEIVRSWLMGDLEIPAGKNHVKHWVTCDREDMVGETRNQIVMSALSLGCTHVFFVDDDLDVPESALAKLYAHDLDVVGGWYPKKTSVIESSTLVSTPGSKSKRGVPLDATGLVKVDWALAAGLSLVKTEVYRKLKYPWYLTTEHGTEDTYFSARCREAGITSWLDTDVRAVHVNKKTGARFYFPERKRDVPRRVRGRK